MNASILCATTGRFGNRHLGRNQSVNHVLRDCQVRDPLWLCRCHGVLVRVLSKSMVPHRSLPHLRKRCDQTATWVAIGRDSHGFRNRTIGGCETCSGNTCTKTGFPSPLAIRRTALVANNALKQVPRSSSPVTGSRHADRAARVRLRIVHTNGFKQPTDGTLKASD